MRCVSKPARLNVSVSNPSRMMRMIRNLLSARHRKSPGRVNRGFISWRVRGAGARAAPSVFSLHTNSTHAIWPRSAGLRNFFAVGKLSAAAQDHP